MLTAAQAHLIQRLHHDFPLTDRPFATLGQELGWTEERILERLHQWLAQGVFTHFGPHYAADHKRATPSAAVAPEHLWVAMAVPEQRFDAVSAVVSSFSQVTHSYRRQHALNMWFVIAAPPEQQQATLAQIETLTRLPCLGFSAAQDYAQLGARDAAVHRSMDNNHPHRTA